MKIAALCPIPCRGVVYELECNDAGLVEYVSATVPVPEEAQWPQAVPDPSPGVKLGLNIPSPAYPDIRMELRVVEGLLSFWGIESIDLDNPEQSWLPDTEAERERLHLFSIKQSFEKLSDEELRPMSFDLVARSFLAAWDARAAEIPLSFFRKGRIDSRECRFIEAIYDFYFVVETVYGEGKTKNYQIKQALQQNIELCELVKSTIADVLLLATIAREPKFRQQFQASYATRSPAAILGYFVDVRGFLHHHTLKRPDIWHPEDHDRFELDALVLEHLANAVVFKLAEPFIFSAETVRAYHDLVNAARHQRPAKPIKGDGGMKV